MWSRLTVCLVALGACGERGAELPFRASDGVALDVGGYDPDDVWRITGALEQAAGEPGLQDELAGWRSSHGAHWSVVLKEQRWHTDPEVIGGTNEDGSLWVLDTHESRLFYTSLPHELLHLRQMVRGEPLAHDTATFGAPGDGHYGGGFEGDLYRLLAAHD